MEINSDDLYTMRWHLTNSKGKASAALAVLDKLLGNPQQTVPGIEGEKLLRCPFAVTTGLPLTKTRGKYPKDYPQGAVVHFTAGNVRQKPMDAVHLMSKNKHCYFVIAPDGIIYQNFPLDRWGYHAGKSAWPGIRDSVSNELVGIEVMCPGKLNSNLAPWYNKDESFPKSQCRYVEGSEQMEAGWYLKYTDKQEASLEKLIRWLHSNNPEVFSMDYVLGHDEVSGPIGLGYQRKNDPGGSLSMSMEKFRATLKA